MTVNLIDKSIISSTLVKRPREVNYKLEVSDILVFSYNLDLSTLSIVISRLESNSNIYGGPRKKRKLNT